MATFGIESNGRLEKTAVYYNGEQVSGLKEVFINLDENGTFDAILQYEGSDKQIRTKSIFNDYLENVKIVEPSFSEEEAQNLQLFVVESDGEIENTLLFMNDEPVDGVVSLFIHIKAAESITGIGRLFGKSSLPDHVEFKAEITYRNEDDSLDTEGVF